MYIKFQFFIENDIWKYKNMLIDQTVLIDYQVWKIKKNK